MYEVWTKHENGERGTLLCISTEAGCKRYVQQAVEKGASPDRLLCVNQEERYED